MPTPRTPPEISFRVYWNYLKAIRYILAAHYASGAGQLPALRDAIVSRATYQGIRQQTHARPERLERLLDIAWQTEVALNLPGIMQDDELSALSIQWGAIELYFSIRAAAGAWFEAMQGPSAPKYHAAELGTLSDFAAKKAMFPLPWGAACRSCTPASFCGELDNYQPGSVDWMRSPTPQNAVDYLCLALRRLRERELDKEIAKWKLREDRRAIRGAEKAELDVSRPTTMFDFLWTLRKRATYIDAEFFALGGVYQEEAVNFMETLCRIGAASLLMFELLLVKAYGKAHMRRFADGFLGRSKYGDSTLGRRLPLW